MTYKIRKKECITILIPAFNEEKNIEKIVKDSKKLNSFTPDVLVIVDSKTTDKTALLAKKAGARVLEVKNSKGKGTNIATAIKQIKGTNVVQIDADYQFLPSDIPALLLPLERGFDVVLGTRYQAGSKVQTGSVSVLKLIGSYFLSSATSIVIGQRVTDVMAGFKAFKTPVLKKLHPKTHHFGYEAELVIRAARMGYAITNVPIHYKKREIGSSNVQSLKHGVLVLWTILKTRLEPM